MITVYIGDRAQAMRAIAQRVRAHQKAHPHANIIRQEGEEQQIVSLENEALGENLFGDPAVIVCVEILKSDRGEQLLAKLKELARSANTFLLYESKVRKGEHTEFEKVGAEIIEFVPPIKKEEASSPGVFALADALVSRDKRIAWMLLTRVFRDGAEPEEVHGTLFWAIKMAILSHRLSRADATKVGVKPFVYGKYGRMAPKWTAGELEGALRSLKDVYHEAHRGRYSLESALERLVLNQK